MNETKVNTTLGDLSSPETKKALLRPYWYRPEVGPQPPFILISTNIGLGGNVMYALLQGPDGDRYECGIESALHAIDLIQEPDRTKLLSGAEQHYDLPLGSMMGAMCKLPNEGGVE